MATLSTILASMEERTGKHLDLEGKVDNIHYRLFVAAPCRESSRGNLHAPVQGRLRDRLKDDLHSLALQQR